MGLFLGSLFSSIDLYVCFVPIPYCFDYCALVVLSEVREQFPLLLLLTGSYVFEVSNSALSFGSVVEMCAVSTGDLNFIHACLPSPTGRVPACPPHVPGAFCVGVSPFTSRFSRCVICPCPVSQGRYGGPSSP